MSTVKELTSIVLDRYRYKGRHIELSAKKTLKHVLKQTDKIQGQDDIKEFIVIDMSGQGELALILALMYPDSIIHCYMESSEAREILSGCIDNFVRNIRIIDMLDCDFYNRDYTQIYAIINDKKTKPRCDLDRAITIMY